MTDLEGKTVIPGLIDAHTHAPGTLMSEMYAIPVPNTSDLDEVLRVVKEFVDSHPEMDAYFGRGYSSAMGDSTRGPKKEWLDEISPDKPIILKIRKPGNCGEVLQILRGLKFPKQSIRLSNGKRQWKFTRISFTKWAIPRLLRCREK